MSNSSPHSNVSTPSSESTVYFDAPIMHFFGNGKDNSDNNSGEPATVPDATAGDPESSLTYNYTNGVVRPNTRDSPAMFAPETHSVVGGEAIHGVDFPNGAGQTSSPNAMTGQSEYEYAPTSPRNGSVLRKASSVQRLKPMPVVWTDADAERNADSPREPGTPTRARPSMGSPRRSQSLRSFRPSTTDLYDQDSVHTAPSTLRMSRRRISLSGGGSGGFAKGAGTVGPRSAARDEETSVFRSRSIHADAGLSKKQQTKISKSELKEGKRVVKVMKEEAKAEKKALEVDVKELADIQRMQKNAIKEEAKTNTSYAQALRVFHKEELEYLTARSKYERAQADLQAYEESREAAREHAREATEMLQEKNREIEWLRAQKAADDREREAKIRQMTGKA